MMYPPSPRVSTPWQSLLCVFLMPAGERERMAAYRFGGLEGTLLRLGESGLMSMIG